MNIAEEKKALRRELIQRRKEMSSEAKERADESIFRSLLPLLEQCSGVFTYVSTDIEVDTRRIIRWCFEHSKPVATPVSGDTELTFYRIRSFEELSAGRFGILEPILRDIPAVPDERTLCIVPALMCNKSGFRLGYGRGYYDRFLSGFSGKSAVICYSDFVGEVPTEPTDRCAGEMIVDSGQLWCPLRGRI